MATRIGVISDTHNLLRPDAIQFLHGSDLIIHGGDICNPGVLVQLSTIAPVAAVRGNNDKGDWSSQLRESEIVHVERVSIYVIHDLADIDIDPKGAGVRVVVSGHSHRPRIEERDGVLFVNPGSVGPRRFKLPISLAEIRIAGESVEARYVELG